MKENLISTNPCDLITLPQLQRYEYHFYNAEQVSPLFETIKDEPIYPLIRTTVVYGLRRSEVLGLKWDSVNFDNNSIIIKHTVSMGTSVVEKDKTKNATSYRSFPLTDNIKQLFLNAKENEEKNKKYFGNTYIKNNYIFKWDDGRPYAPTDITHKFNDILAKYSLPHIRFHELRYSCASLLIAMGFTLKDIQEWLGHADIKMTANIYSHLHFTRKNSMAEAMANSFKN